MTIRFFVLDTIIHGHTLGLQDRVMGVGAMVSMLRRFFAQDGIENEDDLLGCDMAPAPLALGLPFDSPQEEGVLSSASSMIGGPFTTMAQAPIRDS